MAVTMEAVTFEVADPSAAAAFWAALLSRSVVAESGAALLPGDLTQVGLRFITSEMRAVGRPRLHLHLTSTSLEDQQRTITTALRLGGRHHDVGQTGVEGFVVLADPEGTEFCVIEPGNNYLAGTGYLGEITCEGSRAVGLFGVTRWDGRWCGRKPNRPRSSHLWAVRRSPGIRGTDPRPNPATEEAGNAST